MRGGSGQNKEVPWEGSWETRGSQVMAALSQSEELRLSAVGSRKPIVYLIPGVKRVSFYYVIQTG